MESGIPKRPSGGDAMSKLLMWLFDMALGNRILHIVGGRLERSTRGVTIIVDSKPANSDPPTWI